MENDIYYHKLNEIAIAVPVSDVGSLLKQINTRLVTWYEAIDLANAFVFCYLSIKTTRNNLLSVGRASSIPLQFYLEDI